MGWLRDNLFAVSVLALLVSGGLLAAVLGYAALVVLSAFWTGTPVVGVLFDLAVPFLPVTAVLLVAVAVSGVGVGWALLSRLTRPRGGRLHAAAERLERAYPPAETLGVADLLAPDRAPEEKAEDALDELKRRYVAGDIDEREFERRLDRLVAADSVEDARATRERERVLDDRDRSA